MDAQRIAEFKRNVISIVSRAPLRNTFPGEWESVFMGEGMEFAEIRPFEPGDRPQNIHPPSLVQSEEERTVLRVETRQMKVYVWADFSASVQSAQMVFAQKSVVRDVAIGLILFSAQKLYSPVSLYAFGLENPKFFKPKLGEGYCLEIWKWLCENVPDSQPSSSGLKNALTALTVRATPRNIVFLISDFQQKVFDGDFMDLLRPVAANFDLIPVMILDPLESGKYSLPSTVRMRVSSGSNARELCLTPKSVKKIQAEIAEHVRHLTVNFRRLGIVPVILDEANVEECAKRFRRFFETRRRV